MDPDISRRTWYKFYGDGTVWEGRASAPVSLSVTWADVASAGVREEALVLFMAAIDKNSSGASDLRVR